MNAGNAITYISVMVIDYGKHHGIYMLSAQFVKHNNVEFSSTPCIMDTKMC